MQWFKLCDNPNVLRLSLHYRREFRRGLAIIDLFAVMAILTILLAFLVSALSCARERNNGLRCGSNLRQIGTAMWMYANQEKDGSFPRTIYSSAVSTLILTNQGFGDTAVGAPFDTTVGTNNVGASFFLLIRTQDITPDVWLCPTANGTRNPAVSGTASCNFGGFSTGATLQDCTYGYQVPFPSSATEPGFKFTNVLGADFAVAADISPGSATSVPDALIPTTVRFDSRQSQLNGANSRNHRGVGQNVLYADGHVNWQTTPFCGAYRTAGTVSWRDNIYTASSISSAGGVLDSTAQPVDLYDSIMLPTDN